MTVGQRPRLAKANSMLACSNQSTMRLHGRPQKKETAEPAFIAMGASYHRKPTLTSAGGEAAYSSGVAWRWRRRWTGGPRRRSGRPRGRRTRRPRRLGLGRRRLGLRRRRRRSPGWPRGCARRRRGVGVRGGRTVRLRPRLRRRPRPVWLRFRGSDWPPVWRSPHWFAPVRRRPDGFPLRRRTHGFGTGPHPLINAFACRRVPLFSHGGADALGRRSARRRLRVGETHQPGSQPQQQPRGRDA